MNTPWAIEAKNIYFGYSQNDILLQNVNFQIPQKSFIGIIGPNGGGKSTLLKLILGFIKPNQGSILFFGSLLHHNIRLAYVPQSLHFDKKFPITVLEVVLGGRAYLLPWWGSYRKDDIASARKALQDVGLEELENYSFGDLSGGQAQRVLVARALVSRPSILLLDEPTASVDSQAEKEILNIIQSLRGSMTILMVTHDVQTAVSHHLDGLLCIQGGAVYMQPKEVCEHFALGLYHFPLIDTQPQHFGFVQQNQEKIDVTAAPQ